MVEDVLTRLDIEENGVRLKLTVVDTPGFGDYVNNDERCVTHQHRVSGAETFQLETHCRQH
jgi:septin family protein